MGDENAAGETPRQRFAGRSFSRNYEEKGDIQRPLSRVIRHTKRTEHDLRVPRRANRIPLASPASAPSENRIRASA